MQSLTGPLKMWRILCVTVSFETAFMCAEFLKFQNALKSRSISTLRSMRRSYRPSVRSKMWRTEVLLYSMRPLTRCCDLTYGDARALTSCIAVN